MQCYQSDLNDDNFESLSPNQFFLVMEQFSNHFKLQTTTSSLQAESVMKQDLKIFGQDLIEIFKYPLAD